MSQKTVYGTKAGHYMKKIIRFTDFSLKIAGYVREPVVLAK